MPNVRKIQAAPQVMFRRKKVAAYARVSMESDNLLRSFSNQVSGYSRMIQNRSDWEFAGVYADRGITGTSTANRDEFRRMVADCEEGKIDLIITKTVSRFARNTVDLLETVRHLKELGVDVYFEEQRINTLSGDGELMLTLLAALAQEEAQSIKNNVEWIIHKKFEDGIPNGFKRMLGYDWDGEKYIVIPDEAATVRRIFQMYLNGNSSVQIAKTLNKDGLLNILGNPFTDYNVRFILDNSNYTGNLLLQKRYSPSPGKCIINHREVPMYWVEEAHEAIVSEETFAKVQQIRQEKVASASEMTVTCFSGKLRCGYCGHAVCRRNTSNYKTKPSWICNKVDKKGIDSCKCTRRLAETELIDAATDVFGENYRDAVQIRLDSITVFDNRLEFRMRKGRPRVWERHFDGARGCFSQKIYCGNCGRLFARKSNSKKNYIAWMYRNHDARDCCKPIRESELRQATQDVFGSQGNFEMRFYCNTEKILVFDDTLEFQMKDGGTTTWQRK